jgi:AcrR family transcriptional regulator
MSITDIDDAAPTTPGRGTRERILVAARGLFADQGFARVSMRLVAQGAGVTKPALYYHFRDKQALYEECLGDFGESLAANMRQAVQTDGPPADRLRAVAATLLTGSPFHPVRVHQELLDDGAEGMRERLREIFHGVVVGPVTELFESLRDRGELRAEVSPQDAAGMLIGVCLAFLPRSRGGDGWVPLPINHRGRPLQADAAAQMVSDLVLLGLAVR